MREVGMVGSLLLLGCTSLNAAYDEAARDQATVPVAAGSSSSGEPPGSDEDITTGTLEEATSSSGESSTGEGAENDTPQGRVVFLYAAGPWRGDAGGDSPTDAARALCAEAGTYTASTSRCAAIEPLAVIRTSETDVDQLVAATAIVLEDLPIYGIASDGSAPLAPDVDRLFFGGLELSLLEGGVPTAGADRFWSGGLGAQAGNCNGWDAQLPASMEGAVGTFDDPAGWFDAEDRSCAEPLPILCACVSKPDPFG